MFPISQQPGLEYSTAVTATSQWPRKPAIMCIAPLSHLPHFFRPFESLQSPFHDACSIPAEEIMLQRTNNSIDNNVNSWVILAKPDQTGSVVVPQYEKKLARYQVIQALRD